MLFVHQEESKPSPLTLLAQTCNSIGRDSTASSAAGKSKCPDDVKTSSAGRPTSDSARPSTNNSRTSHPPCSGDADGKDVSVAGGSRSSPVDVVSSPSTTTAPAATGRTVTLSADVGRRRAYGNSPSPPRPTNATSPLLPLQPLLSAAGSTSPSRLRAEFKSAWDYGPKGVGADPDGLYAMQYLAAVAALQRQSAATAAVDVALLPYLQAAHQRLPLHHSLVAAASSASADRASQCGVGGGPVPSLKSVSCSDPCCSRCLQLSAVAAAVATSSRDAAIGCSHCGNHPPPSVTSSPSSNVLPAAGGHGAFAAALSALCRPPALPVPPGTADSSSAVGPSASGLPTSPHTCNWLHPGGAYCGLRFPTVDELMRHLHSHCATAAAAAVEPSPAAVAPFAADLHPVATGSLFAPLAVLYGAASASSSYGPPSDFVSAPLPPPPGAIHQLPSMTANPSSLLRQHHHQQHGLAVAAAAAAATRYHPYRVPPTLLPPSAGGSAAAYPSSLAAYYGALCSMAPGSNGTVPAMRL